MDVGFLCVRAIGAVCGLYVVPKEVYVLVVCDYFSVNNATVGFNLVSRANHFRGGNDLPARTRARNKPNVIRGIYSLVRHRLASRPLRNVNVSATNVISAREKDVSCTLSVPNCAKAS